MKPLLVWMVFGLACLWAILTPAQEPIRESDPKFSKESLAHSETQREQIRQELAGHNLPEWAGDYYYGDGEGMNVDLRLAPKNGFVATWNGCMGLYDLNFGNITWGEGKVGLRFTYPNNPQHRGFEGFPEELIPVRWGARHYLVPSDQMIEFANAINRRDEPRKTAHGMFLLKRGDEKKPATGPPALSAAYAAYVLKKPIRTTIMSVGSSRVAEDQTMTSRHTQIVLKAGQAEGVKVGMEFYVFQPGSSFASAKVTRIEEHTAEAEVEQYEFSKPLKEPTPAVGWKLSTAFER